MATAGPLLSCFPIFAMSVRLHLILACALAVAAAILLNVTHGISVNKSRTASLNGLKGWPGVFPRIFVTTAKGIEKKKGLLL